ncbi:MAG: lipopolysaccharide biosynthesis protein [Proteiniphilum sp.]|jgi:O-antigen/teichoic acid export membrane protein|nr:lipopolysaccharide biosynthesis protein [Proteiniphilum sp.]
MADSALKKKTTHSLFWSFTDKFGQQILNFVSMLALMNIVEPEAYGLTGSLAVFTAFSAILIDSGFGRALLNRKDISDVDYSSVFYFNMLLSGLLYLILFLIAPFLGRVFNTPEVVPVARVMFLSLIFNAFALVFQVIIVKRGDFKGVTKINFLAILIANGVAIAMALIGYGVWALVAQLLLFALLRSLFLWMYIRWSPVAAFSVGKLKTFFAFSSRLLCSAIISAITGNIYPSLIAAFYPMQQVAFFNQAKKYQDIPFLTLSNTFRSVAMLILSEINEDRERLARVVGKLVKSIAFLSFPVGLLMIVTAEPLFFLFFKEKWLAAVPYFRTLTFAGMLSPFILIFNELFIARERADFFLGLEVVKGGLLILLILLLFPKGIMALAVSWIVYVFITLLISVILSGRLVGYRPSRFLKDTLPYLCASLVSVGVACLAGLHVDRPLLCIAINVLVATVLYLAICKGLKLEMVKEIEHWFAVFRRKR